MGKRQSKYSTRKSSRFETRLLSLRLFHNKNSLCWTLASIYGYDKKLAYLNDTNQQGRDARTTLKNLELARNEKGPMSFKNLSYTISKNGKITDLKKAIKQAIKNNANDFLNPPVKNDGLQRNF